MTLRSGAARIALFSCMIAMFAGCGDDDGMGAFGDAGRGDGSQRIDAGPHGAGPDAGASDDSGGGTGFCRNACGPSSDGLSCEGCPVTMCGSDLGGTFCCVCEPTGIWRCRELCSELPDAGPIVDAGPPADSGTSTDASTDGSADDAALPDDGAVDSDAQVDDAQVDDAAVADADTEPAEA